MHKNFIKYNYNTLGSPTHKCLQVNKYKFIQYFNNCIMILKYIHI